MDARSRWGRDGACMPNGFKPPHIPIEGLMSIFPLAPACSPDEALHRGLGSESNESTSRDRVPSYLRTHYWWAYVHPLGVKLFERRWLVNLILWGNYSRLCDAALNELGESLPGTTLQVACVYGDLSDRIGKRAAAAHGRLDVVDVVPIQRSEEHTSELQSLTNLVCRLLLEKK